MASQPKITLLPNSLVVVTGANGLVGSHVTDQLLQSGYRVRGSVRSLTKAGWMSDFFSHKYGPGTFDLVQVPDMAAPGAFNEAIKGAAGFIHVATPVMQLLDPNEAVPMVINGVINALAAAATEPAVKRVVITSSSVAATSPKPNVEFSVDSGTWNEEAVKRAWAPPPYEGTQRRLDVYSAQKTQAEQAAWKWMKENRPGFALNVVLPNANMGKILSPEHQGAASTVGWIKALWNGFQDPGEKELVNNPPQYFINVQDNARVHVAALLYEDVKNERLFSWAAPYNWNDILAVFRKWNPEMKFMDDIPGLGRDLSRVANERAEEMIRRLGREGWTSLEQSVRDAVEGWV